MAMSESTRPDGEFEREDGFGGDSKPDMPFAEEEARDNAEELAETGELELDDEDRLPWLEVDDDEDDFSGHNTGQIVALALLGLVLLGLVVGAIWWFTHRGPDDQLVADGSVIEAPDQPYKVRPENQGGKTFEGTGDTSFAVSEGEARPAQLGQSPDAPKPGFETVDGAMSSGSSGGKPPASSTRTNAEATDSTGVGVQINAYSTKSAAEAGWRDLSQHYDALGGMRYRIVEGKADIGTVYRLQAITENAGAATALCGRLKASGLNCFVKN